MLNIRRENIFLKKWLHHFFEVVFPLRAMRFCLVLVLVEGMQVGKLMNSSHQERVRIKIVIYGDAVTLAVVRRAVITKFCAAVVRYLKLALKVVDPAADERCCIRRKILF